MRLSTKRLQAVTAAGVMALTLGIPAAASAQAVVASASGETTVTVPPSVLDTTVENTTTTTAPGAEVAPEVLGETVESNLAFTGADIAGTAALGAAAIGLGTAFLVGRRRARA